MKVWLKGGLIGIVILIILMIIFTPYVGAIIGYPLSIILSTLGLIYFGDPSNDVVSGIITIYINPIIISFLVGSLIGLLVSKLKSKNNNPQKNKKETPLNK